jgi:Glu-tRNA(Gln) amidotransferase subunit E-like FAD-binding protein
VKVHELKSRITEVVIDDGRRARMLRIADRMEKEVLKLEGLNISTRNKIFKIYLKKETAREDFDKILEKHREKRLKIIDEIVALRIQMKQTASREELARLVQGENFVR